MSTLLILNSRTQEKQETHSKTPNRIFKRRDFRVETVSEGIQVFFWNCFTTGNLPVSV